jgi:hypothetical protein
VALASGTGLLITIIACLAPGLFTRATVAITAILRNLLVRTVIKHRSVLELADDTRQYVYTLGNGAMWGYGVDPLGHAISP